MDIIPSISKLGDILSECLEPHGFRHCYFGIGGGGYEPIRYDHLIFVTIFEKYITFWRGVEKKREKRVPIAKIFGEPHTRTGSQYAHIRESKEVEIKLYNEEHKDKLVAALTDFEDKSGVKVVLIV